MPHGWRQPLVGTQTSDDDHFYRCGVRYQCLAHLWSVCPHQYFDAINSTIRDCDYQGGKATILRCSLITAQIHSAGTKQSGDQHRIGYASQCELRSLITSISSCAPIPATTAGRVVCRRRNQAGLLLRLLSRRNFRNIECAVGRANGDLAVRLFGRISTQWATHQRQYGHFPDRSLGRGLPFSMLPCGETGSPASNADQLRSPARSRQCTSTFYDGVAVASAIRGR